MNENAQKFINGLGLTFKIISGLMFASAMLGFLMYCVITVFTGGKFSPAAGDFAQSAVLSFMFKHYVVLALGQAVIAAGVFYASFRFIKLKRWARHVLEGFAWLLVGFVIWSAGFLTVGSPLNLPLFAKLMMAASMGFWIIPLGILIWLLRKREVREAFENG